ncbi:hypothetical protein [Nonomuraea zeae]|uniref:Uncharacterized protein n=1 Tax=Nonomuraea zeae TaxID=1642303 RepID=A0A5S4FTW9_9ACTN|nr:hypothetical protein [Nonomuraea zeae]TMR13482.1 hypothetical protein ETD85_57585 [Nonomuraea zeae]
MAANAFTFDVSTYFLQGQAVASVRGGSRVEMLADKDFPIKFVYPPEGAIPLPATANVVGPAGRRAGRAGGRFRAGGRDETAGPGRRQRRALRLDRPVDEGGRAVMSVSVTGVTEASADQDEK